MKYKLQTIFGLLVLLNVLHVQADTDSFIITIQSNNPGSSTSTEFTIPTIGTGYNYDVDCGNNGTLDAIEITGDYTCDFTPLGGEGTYQVRILSNQSGNNGFPRIYFNDSGDKLKIVSIDQWGKNSWKSMQGAFFGASNLEILATDVPDLTNVGSLESMFEGALIANPNMYSWDFTQVTDMSDFLKGSGVSIINYDTLLLNLMSSHSLADVIINSVPVTRCSNPAQQAYDGLTTNGWVINDLGICDVVDPVNDFVIKIKTDNVGITDNDKFKISTISFLNYNYNVDCNNDGTDEMTAATGDYVCDYGLTGLNTGNGSYIIRIKDNNGDRTGFPALTLPAGNSDAQKILSLEQWGTSHWLRADAMFLGTYNMVINAMDTPDFIDVNTMLGMFNLALLAKPLSRYWNTSNVEDMSYMFRIATVAAPDTRNWNTAKVNNMGTMFYFAESANPDTSGWDTSQVIAMYRMFSNAVKARPNTDNWDVSQVLAFNEMFTNVTLPTSVYDGILTSFNNSNPKFAMTLDGGNSTYCAVAAHNNLTNETTGYGWNIIDAGMSTNCSQLLFKDGFETTL